VTGVGTDLYMVSEEREDGKTTVPSTQNRLTVSGDTQEAKVTVGVEELVEKKHAEGFHYQWGHCSFFNESQFTRRVLNGFP
jgi:hypothetical protein